MAETSEGKTLKLFSRSMVTLDGLWFLAVEDKYGLETAMELDKKVWESFPPTHLKRVAKAFSVTEGGIAGFIRVFELDSLWIIFKPVIQRIDGGSLILRCTDCPPQKARIRDGRGEFPCKPVGVSCFGNMVKAFAPEARVSCIVCPADPHPQDVWCEWKIEEGG